MKRRMGEAPKRKTRSDKKKQLRPWLPGTLVSEIKSLAKFTGSPSLAATMETLLKKTLMNRSFIEYVKPSMYRTTNWPTSPDATYFSTLLANPQIEYTAEDLYRKIKEGITQRASFFVTREFAEHYLHPLTSGLNISADGLATIALDYVVKRLLPSIHPDYQPKYHITASQRSVLTRSNLS